MKPIWSLFALLLLLPTGTYGQTSITFTLTDAPSDAKIIGVRGSILPLQWDRSIPLQKAGAKYQVTLDFEAADTVLEFKFVLENPPNELIWERTNNRTLPLSGQPNDTTRQIWNREQVMDISTLQPIPPEALLADYALVETMVKNVHPGTYRYNTKQQIEDGLARLKQRFGTATTHQEAYLALSRLTAQIQCDHTKPGFNNQTPVMNAILHYQQDKLPFTFRWVDSQMVVIFSALDQPALRRGTIIKSLNGVPVPDIQKQLLPYVGADGATDQNRIYKLEVNGYDFRYNAFDVFYPLVFPPMDTVITATVQVFGSNQTEPVDIPLLTREDRAKRLTATYPDFPATRDDLWSFQVLSDSVGLLTMNSFGLYGWKAMTIDYKAFLAEAFQQMDQPGIGHLIIDIRENTGGNDEMADELFRYLTSEPFQFDREGRTRYLDFPESLKPHVQTWGENPWYYSLDTPSTQTPDGYYVFPEQFSPDQDVSLKGRFRGKAYLLTGPANTSLAYYTASRFQQQGLGTLIGQETGGNLRDINGGQILFLKLPNTEIEIDFPVMGGFTKTPQRNGGVQPDILVQPSLQDIIENQDVALERTLRLIQMKK